MPQLPAVVDVDLAEEGVAKAVGIGGPRGVELSSRSDTSD